MIELSNLSNPAAQVVDEARVASTINWADRLIDTYLAQRYSLPFPEDEIPYVLSACSADLARYKLDRECKFREGVRDDYEDQIRWLRDVAAGRVSLGPRPDLTLGEDVEQESEQEIWSHIPPSLFEEGINGY